MRGEKMICKKCMFYYKKKECIRKGIKLKGANIVSCDEFKEKVKRWK